MILPYWSATYTKNLIYLFQPSRNRYTDAGAKVVKLAFLCTFAVLCVKVFILKYPKARCVFLSHLMHLSHV
jgi:hypothetical protein